MSNTSAANNINCCNGAVVVCSACVFPAMVSQNICCDKVKESAKYWEEIIVLCCWRLSKEIFRKKNNVKYKMDRVYVSLESVTVAGQMVFVFVIRTIPSWCR